MTVECGKTIMLVEDDILTAMTEKMTLEKHGYYVIIAKSGEKAVEIIRMYLRIDLVLMTVDLFDGIDGIQAAEIILNERTLPIIFLSNHFDSDVSERTKNIISYGYVLKNSSFMVLDASIQMALRLFDSQQESLLKMGTWRLDLETNLFTASEPGLRLFGFPLGSHPAFSDVVACFLPEDRQVAAVTLQNALKTGEPYSVELQIHRADTGECRSIVSMGEIIPGPDGRPAAVQGKNQDVTERRLIEEGYQNQLSEKDLMLKEVHHRMKNNMHTLASMFSLQSGILVDSSAREVISEAGRRVKSMMVLYEKLYQGTDFNRMSVFVYLPALVDEIVANFPNSWCVTVEKKIDDFILDILKLQPLGIILNELISNIMKYAFIGRNDALISVTASLTDNRVTIILGDNGCDLPECVNFENSESFGLLLVGTLIKQLRGSILIERGCGTRICMEFNR